MKTAHGYIRVSTSEQKLSGYSPDNQIRQIREFAKMHGYNIIKFFDDSGRSGRSAEKRPQLQELLREIEKKPVDAIIIYKIDRFARNVTDFSKMYNHFKEKKIILLSVNEGNLMESNSLIPNIFASVAQWESETNSTRTKDALAQKFEEGWQPTPPLLGYRTVGGEKEKKTCEPDPFVAPIIKQLFEMYSTGNYSLYELQNWLADKNITSKTGKIIGYSVIDNILRNPFYFGLIRWHGVSKMGKHIPLITKALYDTVQFVLAKHRSFLLRKRIYDYLLRGFMFCGYCSQRYTADKHKINSAKRKGVIHYYHCQKRGKNGCPATYVEAEVLEKQVEREIGKLQFTQEFIDKVVQKAKEHVEESRNSIDTQRLAILNQKTELENKRNKLEIKMLDDTIDRETYQRLHTDFNDKISNLNALIQEIENNANLDVDLIEEVLAFTRNIHTTYLQAPQFLKRHYLRFFFEKLVVKDRKIIKIVYTPIFSVLQENHAVIIRTSQLRD